MKIDVNEQTINQFFTTGSNVFVIPDYQRPYSWKLEQLEELWDDVETLEADDSHFIGSFVLISKTNRPGDFNELEVVDGQQRLTTLSLFIKALYDFYDANGESDVTGTLDNYLHTTVIRQDKRLKLRPGRNDRNDYVACLEGNSEAIKGTGIHTAYSFFVSRISEHPNPDELMNKVLYALNFVVIYTDSDKSAYRLFETLNDRGLALSAVDLIKNHLLKVVSEKELNIDKTKLAWETTIQNLDDIDAVRFFRHYLLSTKLIETRGKLTKEKLYDRFCEVLQKVDSIEDLIEDIRLKSELYYKIANAQVDKFDANRSEVVNKHLRNIAAIKATTSYTFILRLFSEVDSAEEIISVLKLIEIFAVRRSIVGVSTADIDIIYNALSLDAFTSQDGFLAYTKQYLQRNTPTNEDFQQKFSVSQFQQNDQTKYILDKLATEGYGAGQGGMIVGNSYNVHIEHIAPQSMKNPADWSGFELLEAAERKEMISSIGNLTLLEKKPNIQASNSTFADKKEFYSKESTDIALNHALLEFDDWTVETIKSRGKELAEKATRIWSY